MRTRGQNQMLVNQAANKLAEMAMEKDLLPLNLAQGIGHKVLNLLWKFCVMIRWVMYFEAFTTITTTEPGFIYNATHWIQ